MPSTRLLFNSVVVCSCSVQLIWGTDDTILEPRQDAELLGGWAGHVEGWWVVGGSHAIIADSTLPVCEKVQASYASLAA